MKWNKINMIEWRINFWMVQFSDWQAEKNKHTYNKAISRQNKIFKMWIYEYVISKFFNVTEEIRKNI